ncbi:hypothetical protein pipiens_018601, partial [Culex pipiens pipiens]
GYCSAVFHLKCSGVSESLLAAVDGNRQVFWMCRSCTTMLLDMRHRKSVHSAFMSGQESLVDTHSQSVAEMKSELTELKAEIRSNFASLKNSNSLTPRSSRRPGDNPDLRKKLFHDKLEPKKQSQPLLQGTGNPVSPSFSSMLVDAPTPKFWLYMTRISRTVTVDQVTKLAVERLGVQDVKVTRLVAKGKDVNTMSFISFKIGMDTSLKEKALATSTWPQGLIFREFEDRSTEIFWAPIATASANPTASGATGTTTTPESTPPNLPAAGDGSENPNLEVESMEE